MTDLSKLSDKEFIGKAKKAANPTQVEYPHRRLYLVEAIRRLSKVAQGPAPAPMPTVNPVESTKRTPPNQRAASARTAQKKRKSAPKKKPATTDSSPARFGKGQTKPTE